MGKGDTHKKKHSKNHFVKHDLVIANKNEGEFYARVMSILNGNRLKVKDNKGDEIQVGIRGNFFYGSKKENLNFPDMDRHEYWVLVQPGISKNQYFLKQHLTFFVMKLRFYGDGDCYDQNYYAKNHLNLFDDYDYYYYDVYLSYYRVF